MIAPWEPIRETPLEQQTADYRAYPALATIDHSDLLDRESEIKHQWDCLAKTQKGSEAYEAVVALWTAIQREFDRRERTRRLYAEIAAALIPRGAYEP